MPADLKGTVAAGQAAAQAAQQMAEQHRVETLAELDAVHRRVLDLGGTLRLDGSDDPEEPLRVYADRDGHTCCVFVA